MDGAMMDGTTTAVLHEIDPGDPRALRGAFGAWPTGVAIVTARGPEGPVGITANSFASVSLDPPLLLWSPARSSARFPVFAAAEDFAVHVLAESQLALAEAFTRDGRAFAGLDLSEGPGGVPLIGGVLARFCCRTVARHEAGDHLIIVGRIGTAARAPGGAPLVFSAGRYGGLAPG